MTVRVTQKMRKRIDARKRIVAMKKEKELVTDNSHRDIHKRGFIYESPDAGKTIYRRPSSYCDVSGVKIDETEQLEFNFNNIEDEVNEREEKGSDLQLSNRIVLAKISQVATLIDEIAEEIKSLHDNN